MTPTQREHVLGLQVGAQMYAWAARIHFDRGEFAAAAAHQRNARVRALQARVEYQAATA